MRAIKNILSLFFLVAFFCLHAQQTDLIPFKRCPVKTINYEQGLMNNSIRDVITDDRGFTWVSTKTGLQRYNGYFLENITPVANGDTVHINYPVHFLAGRKNSILIGYREGVLEYMPGMNGFKKIISIVPVKGSKYAIVPMQETEDAIWCLEENKGMVVFNHKGILTGTFLSKESSGTDNLVRSEDFYSVGRKLVAINENYIFIRIALNKIVQVNTHTQQLKTLDYPGAPIVGLECNGDKIFVAAEDGLAYIRINDGSTSKKFLYNRLIKEQVSWSSIDFSVDSLLMVSVQQKLFEFDTSCVCLKEITTLNREPLLNAGYIHLVYEDKFRRIWLLTNDDMKRIQHLEIPFAHYIYPKEKNNFVRCIYYDSSKNILLAGCFNGGIQLYDSTGGALWNKPLITEEVKDIISIDKLTKDDYLVVTLGKGLFLLNLPSRQLQPLHPGNKLSASFNIRENTFASCLQRVDANTVLISTKSNVFRCPVEKNGIGPGLALLSSSQASTYTITGFIYASDKRLWVGTLSGAILILDATGHLQTINMPDNYEIRCFAEDKMRNIWVGTEKGLYIYDSAGRLLKLVNKESGLLNDFIYALQPADSNNNFFASTNLGLSLISSNGKVNNYARELGLQENEFNTQSCARSPQGKLFFGGVNGITAFYPSALSGFKDFSLINITRFLVNDTPYNLIANNGNEDSVRLPYNYNHLRMDIAATGLSNPNEYFYQYRLKNYEGAWQTSHQPTDIRYTLSPGSYLLEINCRPVLSSNTMFYKKIMIIIDPPWWQTWWFRLLSFAMLVFVIAVIVFRYNHVKYLQKIQDLQLQNEIQNERERISRELHDNIGTQLSYISSNVDFMLQPPVSFSRQEEKRRLSVLGDIAKNLVSDLRETIWAMKKESVQLDELGDKIKLFLQSQCILQPQLTMNVQEHIEKNSRFSPIEALNIFRICQEAIVNSIKHSNAEKICLQIRSGPGEGFLFIIQDNGKGFAQNGEYKGHYGLENMKHRAAELNAKLLIHSSAGEGTCIRLTGGE